MTAENLVPDKHVQWQKVFTIRIDRIEYEWLKGKITGVQLRRLPPDPIPPERDLFQVIPGHPDRKIKNDDAIEVHDGLDFFTAPKDNPEQKVFTIRIDRIEYEWLKEKITGVQLRRLPPDPIPPERDLFQVIPGHPDRKIKNDDAIEVHDGLDFFTAPKDNPEQKVFTIRIDRIEYKWLEEKITGVQLRRLPPDPIPPERDLFQVIPGHPDRKIKNTDTVDVHDGLRFFTAPNTINPGTNRANLRMA